MTSSAAPSSRLTRSADIESITTIIAWGAQVVSVIVSNHVLDASTLVPPSFSDSSSPDVGLHLVSLVRMMNSVILILAVIGLVGSGGGCTTRGRGVLCLVLGLVRMCVVMRWRGWWLVSRPRRWGGFWGTGVGR